MATMRRSFTAPGATLFPQYIGDVFIVFTSVSCKFLTEIHDGEHTYLLKTAPPGTPQATASRADG